MYRGTTPTFTFTLPIECETISKLSVAFKQGGELLFERGLPDVTMSGNVLSCTLTEEETLQLRGDTELQIQLRVGVGSARMASQVFRMPVSQILKRRCAYMTLDVQFAAPSAFVVEFGTDADLTADLGQTTILSTAPQYKGETTVTPRTYEETRLETKDKLMPDDVTVRKIPRYEVSNDCGGVTLIMEMNISMANQYVNKVIIGKEVKLDLTADSVTPGQAGQGHHRPR